jgi:hypothetical protein
MAWMKGNYRKWATGQAMNWAGEWRWLVSEVCKFSNEVIHFLVFRLNFFFSPELEFSYNVPRSLNLVVSKCLGSS